MLEVFGSPEADDLHVDFGAISLQGKVWNEGILASFQYCWLSSYGPAMEAELIELFLNGAIKINFRRFGLRSEKWSLGYGPE